MLIFFWQFTDILLDKTHDEQLIRRLIEKVTVYEGKFSVEFKSGVTVEVEG